MTVSMAAYIVGYVIIFFAYKEFKAIAYQGIGQQRGAQPPSNGQYTNYTAQN